MDDPKPKILIAGATGFIGKALTQRLSPHYQIIALSRNAENAQRLLGPKVKAVHWNAKSPQSWAHHANDAFAIINLAGQNIAASRWTKAAKNTILQSRLDAARAVADVLKLVDRKPKVVIQASAIGYYGPRGYEKLYEDAPPGDGFLPEVCRQVEQTTSQITELGVRLIILRTGVVLGPDRGALPRFAAPFRFYLGGYAGSPNQWLSWISQTDQSAAIQFLLEHQALSGPFNLTSPNPVTIKDFSKTLGKALQKPAWTRMPSLAVRLIFGQMGTEVVLCSQRVLPKRLLEAGFEFEHIDVGTVLRDIYNRKDYHEPR